VILLCRPLAWPGERAQGWRLKRTSMTNVAVLYSTAGDCTWIAQQLLPANECRFWIKVVHLRLGNFQGDGKGTYTASYSLEYFPPLDAAYDTCSQEDAQSLNDLCGKYRGNVHSAKGYIQRYITEAKVRRACHARGDAHLDSCQDQLCHDLLGPFLR
jgi:hypothetical protein